MPLVSSFHFLLGPLVAFAAMGVIVLLCRWVFSTDHRSVPHQEGKVRDLGLLVPLTVAPTAEDAAMLGEVLRAGGIRCNVTEHREVLVFRTDLEAAKQLVGAP